MNRIQAPAFLNDLYRDLRDRRLLLPAAVLLVALVAAPMLLTGSPQSVAGAPAPIAAADQATAVESAVLAEQVGIRDYRKRLQALNSKNPFDQQFSPPDEGAEAVASAGTSATETAPSGPASADAGTLSSGVDPGTTSDSGATTSPPPATDVPTSSDPSGGKRKAKLVARRIDVTIGPLGETERMSGVRELDFLPSEEVPVVVFLGVSEDGKRAVFLLSDDVVATDGEGACVPDPCEFLSLKVGQQQYMQYQPEGELEPIAYRLKLLRVRETTVKRSSKK